MIRSELTTNAKYFSVMRGRSDKAMQRRYRVVEGVADGELLLDFSISSNDGI